MLFTGNIQIHSVFIQTETQLLTHLEFYEHFSHNIETWFISCKLPVIPVIYIDSSFHNYRDLMYI